MRKQSPARALVTEQMPELPDGYYFKVKKWNLSYDYEIILYRKRLNGWWFSRRVDYTLAFESNVVSSMKSLSGKAKVKLIDRELVGKYVKPSKPAPQHPLTADKEVHYDEVTQTFTLSDELIERLRNGE